MIEFTLCGQASKCMCESKITYKCVCGPGATSGWCSGLYAVNEFINADIHVF